MNKTKKISLITLLLLICVVAVYFVAEVMFIGPHAQEQYIAKNCPGYKWDGGFVDSTKFIGCKGVIGIEKYSDENFLTVFNASKNRLETWDSFHVHKYQIVGNELYYIEDQKLNIGESSYIFITESSKKTTFSPYRKIDTSTGDFTLYKTLDEVPAGEKEIFQQLISSK